MNITSYIHLPRLQTRTKIILATLALAFLSSFGFSTVANATGTPMVDSKPCNEQSVEV